MWYFRFNTYLLSMMLLGNVFLITRTLLHWLFKLLPVLQAFWAAEWWDHYLICLLGKLSSMGYGFIQYKTPKAAQKAIRQLQVNILSKHQFCELLFLYEISKFLKRNVFFVSAALYCRWASTWAENFWKRIKVRQIKLWPISIFKSASSDSLKGLVNLGEHALSH